jgi:putative ABC transport system ATP-binding protein
MGDVEVPVLHDVNLDIASGAVTVVVGPSGSGKSTLLNLVGGIDRPSAGEILFDGRDIAHFSDAELTAYRRETVGFVFQFYNLVPTLTARENVMVSTEISSGGLDPDEALRLVGLEHRIDHFPSQMSGGEQQRVAIARAVAKNPRLLLCDEPTGALDLAIGRNILGVLCRLKRELEMSIVIITHNSAIADMSDFIVRIGSGTIAESHRNARPIEADAIEW